MVAKLLVLDPETGAPIGIIDARRCDAKDHEPRLATKLLHWVTGPIDYCDRCAAHMLHIAEVLGTHVGVEEIAPPEVGSVTGRRAIEL